MLKYTAKRLFQTIILLFIISIVVFMIIRLIPGDPVLLILGSQADSANIEYYRETLGLNDPIYIQYVHWIQDVLHGDFGTSIITRQPIVDEILARYPNTIILAIGGTAVGSLLGIVLGIIAAVHHGRWKDNTILVCSLIFVSVPSFFLALLLLLFFCLRLGWLPSYGLTSPKHAILPILTLGLGAVGSMTRTTRTSMLDVINQDYIRTSRSRGIPERIVIYKHTLRNALIPIVTSIGLRFGGLLAGATLVETIFSTNGLGQYIVNAVSNRDYPAIQGGILVTAVSFTLVNLAVDLLYHAIDPRVKYD